MDDPRQSGLVETRRRVCVRSYPVVTKWELGLRGAGAAWVMYPGTACAWLLRVCGRGGVRQRPMTTKDPPGGTQHWRHRSTCSEGDCRVPRRRNLLGQVRREEVPSALSTRAKKCGGACLAKGQKAAICASPLSSWATSRGRCPGVQEKFFPARRAHNMVLSWHHPGHL